MEKLPALLRFLFLVLAGFLASSLLLLHIVSQQFYSTLFFQQGLIFLAPALIWLKWENVSFFKTEKSSKGKRVQWILVSLCVLAGVYVFNDLLRILLEQSTWGKQVLAEQNNLMTTYKDAINNGSSLWLPVLAISILPAVAEELFFRRILFTWNFNHTNRFWRSACISSGLFALLHFQPIMLPSMFVLAILFCWLCLQTGSIWVGILLHASNNLLQVLQLRYEWEVPIVFWCVVLVLSAVGLIWQKWKKGRN